MADFPSVLLCFALGEICMTVRGNAGDKQNGMRSVQKSVILFFFNDFFFSPSLLFVYRKPDNGRSIISLLVGIVSH